jgi:uncharacterized membrane protein (UPF0136 family)
MFNTVIWIYVALLIVGGLMGFIKSKSRISLVSSAIFAVLLALVALRVIAPPYIAEIIIGFLFVLFAVFPHFTVRSQVVAESAPVAFQA